MLKFDHTKFSEKDLKNIKLSIPSQTNNPRIDGVYYKNLSRHVDGRGDLVELWSQPWSESEPVEGEVKHVYYNTTHQGVTKGWHVHEKTSSQYTCVQGKMQVVLVDARKESKTFGYVDTFMVGSHNPSYIKIPAGVLKAWKSIQGDAVIVNLLTSSDTKDNFKYAWDSILTDIWEPKNG